MYRHFTQPELNTQLVLSILATLGNLTVIVGASIKIKTFKTCFTYLKCLLVVDSVYFLGTIIHWSSRNELPNFCQFVKWAHITPLAGSVWLIIVMLVDKSYREGKKSGRNASVHSLAISVFVLVVVIIITLLTSCPVLEETATNSTVKSTTLSDSSMFSPTSGYINNRLCNAILKVKKGVRDFEVKYAVRRGMIVPRNTSDNGRQNQFDELTTSFWNEDFDEFFENAKENICHERKVWITERSPLHLTQKRIYFWESIFRLIFYPNMGQVYSACLNTNIPKEVFICRQGDDNWISNRHYTDLDTNKLIDEYLYYMEMFLEPLDSVYEFQVLSELFTHVEYKQHAPCFDCILAIQTTAQLTYPVENAGDVLDGLRILRSELRKNHSTATSMSMLPTTNTENVILSSDLMNQRNRTSALIQSVVYGIIPSIIIIILVAVDILKTSSHNHRNTEASGVEERCSEIPRNLNANIGPTMIPLQRLNNSLPPNFGASTSFPTPSAPLADSEMVFEPDARYSCLPFSTPKASCDSVETVPAFNPNPEYVSYPILSTEKFQQADNSQTTTGPNSDEPPCYSDIESTGIFNIDTNQETVRRESYKTMVGNHLSTTFTEESKTSIKSNTTASKCPMWTAIRIMSVLRALLLLISSSVNLVKLWKHLELESQSTFAHVSLWGQDVVLYITCLIFMTFSKSFRTNIRLVMEKLRQESCGCVKL